MIEIDCSMWRTSWHGSPRGEVRVEFQAWDAGYTGPPSDWVYSAESLLPKPNKLSRRGVMFHLRVTFDPLNRPAWRQPPWFAAAVDPWQDTNRGGVPVALAQRSDA